MSRIFLSVLVLLFTAMAKATSTPQPWGPQIFSYHLDKLETFFKSNKRTSNAELLERIYANDVRSIFFRLQALAALYRDLGDPDVESLFDAFKGFEDRIGKAVYFGDISKKLNDIGERDLADYFLLKKKKTERKLINALDELGILKSPVATIENLKTQVAKVKRWHRKSQTSDREFLVDALATRLEELADQLESNDFDKKDIEKGLHELRRELRWPNIQLQALERFVVLESNLVRLPRPLQSWLNDLLQINPEVLRSKYLRIKPAESTSPIVISRELISIASELVGVIGKRKDSAELQLATEEAIADLQLNEFDANRIRAKIEKLGDSDHRSLSRELTIRLNRTRLISRMAKQIRDTNSEANRSFNICSQIF